MTRTERALAALVAGAGLAAAGCATVEPWERGRLAKPHMALEAHPDQRLLWEHTYQSREAGMSGSAGSGGGCGCY